MAHSKINHSTKTPWNQVQKLALRFFTVYFALQILPLDWKFYKLVFSIQWSSLTVVDLLNLSAYMPQFFLLQGFANWAIPFITAVTAAAIWSIIEKNEKDYNTLYYWLRVVLRYRLAIGIIAYGWIKLFPLQMPYPSLSNLHTNYGEFLPWKIYWHTIGITQGYESFLGFGEIVAALLLLYRKTTTLAAGFIIGFTGNVVAANFAYDIGEQIYSLHLLLIALFLFAYDAPRLYRLLFLHTYTIANKFHPAFHQPWLRKARYSLKVLALLFILLFGTTAYSNYKHDPYKIPHEQGLAGSYGFYNVRTFVLNKDTIPYSTTHPERWQNVVFEKWATVSIKIARPVKLDLSNGNTFHDADKDRNFESAGVGGRHYYAYTPDSINHSLNLQNKNKNHAGEAYTLNYTMPSSKKIIVQGVNEKNDSIYAELERIDKKYLLFVGRRKPIKL